MEEKEKREEKGAVVVCLMCSKAWVGQRGGAARRGVGSGAAWRDTTRDILMVRGGNDKEGGRKEKLLTNKHTRGLETICA